MLFLFVVSWVVLINTFQSDATTYTVKLRTSKWPLTAGTDEDVVVTLFGTNGKSVSGTYTGWGLNRLELGQVNTFDINGEDIGSIVGVQARIVQTNFFFDEWRLFWIKVKANEDTYKATFEYTFSYDGDQTNAKDLKVVGCREGFQSSVFGAVETCLDRNECLVVCKKSGQKCTNLPGTYKCECKPGYYLDGTDCRDYDECTSHHRNPCSYQNAHCVNTPGSYECRCNKGYMGNYYACQDVDECKLGQHDCSQKCLNTPGSFHCGCNSGFKLAVDGKTCLDVDECQGANTCNATTSMCYDEYGYHRCVCKVGYKEATTDVNGVEKTICVPVECRPLQHLDQSIQLSPQRCVNGKNYFGEECSVSCAEGYEIDPSSARKLKCTVNGFANIGGIMPKCIPKPCPPLATPKFGYTIPLSCSSTGTTQGKECYMYCDEGFILAGATTYKCDRQTYDQNPSKALCTKIPRIDCPSDVTVTLPQDKGRIALGNNFPFFKTSLRRDQVISNIEGVGPTYEFPVGVNVVAYTAKNEINQTDSCSFVVRVFDKAPPVVEYCPTSVTFLSKGGKPVNVTWPEPRFKDAVKIERIEANVQNGLIRNPTSFLVNYRAVDSSGNTASCQFTVYFKIMQCNFNSISGGDYFVSPICFPSGSAHLCSASCPQQKTFDVINSNHPIFKFIWICKDADFGIDRMPDCVDFQKKIGPCPQGYKEVSHYTTKELVCAKCPRGTYYNNGTCDECPRDTFQSNGGSMKCENCKVGFGTNGKRSKLEADCKPLCPLGYVSSNGLDDGKGSCKMCSKDTYADKQGSITCTKCPNGTTTDGEGRYSVNDCLYATKNTRMVPSGTIEVSTGETVQFDCHAEGSPLPFVLIRKQKSDANPNTHSLLPLATKEPMTRGLRYFISKATIYDSGTYICKAENSKGMEYSQIKLVVTEGSGMGPSG